MKLIKYFSISLFIFTLLTILLFLNLGNILDVSQRPVKSDIIVCLGGGGKSRIKTSLRLYNNKYSTKNILIITGDNRTKKRKEKNMDDKRLEYLENNGSKNINIKEKKNTINTKEEILYIKKYLLENNFTSAIIVSDAPHTRRIKTLIYILKIEDNKKLTFNLIASDNKWWNSNKYLANKKSQVFVLSEILKLGYTYIAYGVFDKIGLLHIIENNTTIRYFKKKFHQITYSYIKEK